MKMKRRAALAALLLLPTGAARGDNPKPTTPVVTGTWFATGKPDQVFAGTWSAEIKAATPNVVVGSWTLTNEVGEVQIQGTWSARKEPKAWRGAWSARVTPGNTIYSGTWEADASALKEQKTFADMLRHAAETQVGGTWRTRGGAHGNWWLRPRR